MAKPRCLEVGDQVVILLPTEGSKLFMQCRGPYIVESHVEVNENRVKLGSTKMYHMNYVEEVYR